MSQDIAKKRILDNVDLGQLIGESLDLQRRSGRYVALCPFHDEKSPSFTIFDDHYYCFGCQARGDAIDFVRKQRGLGFIEALKYLAERFQIETPELESTLSSDRDRQKLKRIYQALQLAKDFFKTQLKSDEGKACREYLSYRGFCDENIENFGFGYAPDRPSSLVTYLLRKGLSLEDINAASLAVTSSRNRRSYDFYQNRLMIPIHDHHGRLIAFGGRALGDDPAKYKNSRDTVVFDKSRTVYGFERARTAMKERNRAIVVEGYMDVLQLNQFGIQEAVACLGTALTSQHIKRIGQICKNVYLVFDGDSAGKRASLKTVPTALDHPECQFYVIRLPDGEDPDSFIRKQGLEAFEDRISQAENLLTYAIETKLNDSHDVALPELIKRELVPWLRSVKDPIKRSFLISRIARIAGISEESLLSALNSAPKQKNPLLTKSKPEEQEVLHNSDQALSEIEQKLSGRQIEFLGHVYFSSSEEIDITEARILKNRAIRLNGTWSDLCEEFLSYIATSQQSPSSRASSDWVEAASEKVIKLIEDLQKDAELYRSENRMNALRRIGDSIQLEQLQATRNALKQSLKQSNDAEIAQILTSIQELNKQMLTLERR